MPKQQLLKADIGATRTRFPRWMAGLLLLGVGAVGGAALGPRRSPPSASEPKAERRAATATVRRESSPQPTAAEFTRAVLQAMAQPTATTPTTITASDDPQVREPTQIELLDTVRTQPRDEDWARPTESALQQDLDRLAAGMRFRVGRVDCRTSRCVADLEWPSGALAQRDFKAVMAADVYRLDCHRRLLLPSADSASGHAQMIFNCDNQVQRTVTQ